MKFVWHVPPAFAPRCDTMCRRSSGVERTLGKGEVDSSILSGGTISLKHHNNLARNPCFAALQHPLELSANMWGSVGKEWGFCSATVHRAVKSCSMATMKWLLRIFVALFTLPAMADDFSGRVILKDVDTVYGPDGAEYRIWGIDAPECNKPKNYIQLCELNGKKDWAAGCDGTAAMRSWIGDRMMACNATGKKTYGRGVVRCWVDGQDFAMAATRMGWTFDSTKYSGGHYAQAESKANQQKLGIHVGKCEKPWVWRRANSKR